MEFALEDIWAIQRDARDYEPRVCTFEEMYERYPEVFWHPKAKNLRRYLGHEPGPGRVFRVSYSELVAAYRARGFGPYTPLGYPIISISYSEAMALDWKMPDEEVPGHAIEKVRVRLTFEDLYLADIPEEQIENCECDEIEDLESLDAFLGAGKDVGRAMALYLEINRDEIDSALLWEYCLREGRPVQEILCLDPETAGGIEFCGDGSIKILDYCEALSGFPMDNIDHLLTLWEWTRGTLDIPGHPDLYCDSEIVTAFLERVAS